MKKIGLALGSGGARGWAHIGVLDALGERGLSVGCIAGTSMGALVGGVFASGHLGSLRESALHLDWKQALYHFVEVTFPRSGLVDGTKVVRFLRKQVGGIRIESLPIPFAAVATDVMRGAEVVIRKGELIEAIRASISIPGIFTPFQSAGAPLVDGGLLNPLPVDVTRRLGADFVIAVDINYKAVGGPPARRPKKAAPGATSFMQNPQVWLKDIRRKIETLDIPLSGPARQWLKGDAQPNIFDILGNSIVIMQAQITETRLKIDKPDLLIRPIMDVGYMEFHRARDAIKAGYDAAQAALAALPRRRLTNWLGV